METKWILIKIETKMGKKHGLPIHKLTFVNAATMEEHEMVVDESMRNYKRCGWDNILNSNEPYGIYGGLRVKANEKSQSRKPVLTADSRIKQDMSANKEQANQLINELKKIRDKGNIFNTLFEEEK